MKSLEKSVFPLRVSEQMKQAIRDRASIDGTSQVALIRKAVELYLLTEATTKADICSNSSKKMFGLL